MDNDKLIQELIDEGYLKTPIIIEAFKKIDRADFVPENIKPLAYLNQALPIGEGQTISQPLTVAFMLELLEPRTGEKILDIGVGSGWQAALLAYIVSKNDKERKGKVIGIDRIKSLVETAEENIKKYNFLEKGVVQLVMGDGSKGYASEAPFDKIIAAAAGELSDILEIPRDLIEKEIEFLIEDQALKRVTWPGLYKDESDRYNFHRDWLQEKLRYPWDYDKDYHELRRLLFGCFHAGYTVTDYEYIRHHLPKIILDMNIDVVELIGDIIAGLKHGLIHRGQIIGNMNYTDQEIFAGELLGTVLYEVFLERFWGKISVQNGGLKNKDSLKAFAKGLSVEELKSVVQNSLALLLYIVGNHDGWQKDLGVTPGVVFRAALLDVISRNIEKFLEELGFSLPRLHEVVAGKIVELPERRSVYSFPGGVCTELMHPGMSRTKTISIRCESALDISNCQSVDLANFHTALVLEKWDPKIGQRVATQVGTLVIETDFEKSKLKTVDFGPVYIGMRYKNGRVFMVEHQFFNKPILQEPISRNTNIDELKNKLNLLRSSLDKQ